MNADFFKRLGTFAVLFVAQILVLNNIHLYGCATPLLYVYFVLSFPRNYPRWGILIWCFALGLAIDMASNTPGVAAGAMTLLGLLQPYFLIPFIPRDSVDDFRATMSTVGVLKYIYYTFICVLTYTVVFFSIEAFNFFNWQQWLWNIGGSALLTILLILVIENLVHHERRAES